MARDDDASTQTRDKNDEALVIGVRVLVVDCDSTSLVIVSRMLHACGYKVITAECASAAFRILEYQQDEIDLILTEVQLPDMDKYQFLERLSEISSLPVVILSADNDEKAMLGGLFKGAEFYLVKPITVNIIKNIWQFLYTKKREVIAYPESSDNFNEESLPRKVSSLDVDCQSHSHTVKAKRKRRKDEMNKDESGDNLIVQKKQKLTWTNELHNRFLQVVEILGIDNAHPKKILQHMNVPGLRKEHISSHLQKHRLLLKRNQDTAQNNMIRDYSPPSSSQADASQHSTTACQTELRCRFCSKNFTSSTYSMPALSSSHYPVHVDLDHNDLSMSSHGKLASQNNQLYCTYSNSIGELLSFDTMGGCNMFKKGTSSTNMANSGLQADVYVPTFVETSIIQQQQQELQDQLQSFLPPSSPIPPALPQLDYDMFEAHIPEIDDLFDILKGSAHMFYDCLDSYDIWQEH